MYNQDLLASYTNGGAKVEIYTDGSKLRTIFDPLMPPLFPEQMDMKITDWCDAGCAWCHERSTRQGKHADISASLKLLTGLPAGVEIAIGGGDPLSHPNILEFLEGLKTIGLIANVTVNGRHLKRHRKNLELWADRELIKGVGISWAGEMPDWNYPHLVLHMIAGIDDPKLILDQNKKVLILGYKRWGRGGLLYSSRAEEIKANINFWYRLLPLLAQSNHLSFDTLAIEQLKAERLFKDQHVFKERFMGREGEYSLYVDAVEQKFATSSYSEMRMDWTNIENMFQTVRQNESLPVHKASINLLTCK